MKVVTIVGARPQFVKAAVVSRAFQEKRKSSPHKKIKELIVHTGQHFDESMSSVFFEQMNIPKPHYNLEVGGLSHGAMTGRMLSKIEEVLVTENPDWVVVYGDTNSTIAGALAAKKLNIKVAHVEAGLRSFNMRMPEEVNRVLTDRISDILFCPTQTALENLKDEGYDNIDAKQVHCGDVMYDAALFYADRASRPEGVVEDQGYVLSTIHRQENTDDKVRLAEIFEALEEIALKSKLILPLHPRTVRKLEDFGIRPGKNIQILEPVGYFEMIWLLSNCSCVVTDSGGLQKEAFFFEKPCITVREETEWVELVKGKVNFLVGPNKERMVSTYNSIGQTRMDFGANLYGNGDTGGMIVEELVKFV